MFHTCLTAWRGWAVKLSQASTFWLRCTREARATQPKQRAGCKHSRRPCLHPAGMRRIPESVQRNVAQRRLKIAGGIEIVQIQPQPDNRLGNLGADADQQNLCAQQARRLYHR